MAGVGATVTPCVSGLHSPSPATPHCSRLLRVAQACLEHDALDVAEGMADAPEGPRIEPGPSSGESINKRRVVKREKTKDPPPTPYNLLGFQ
jgi:hypothetical protein